jgi:replicative DNA helicase
MDIEQVILSNLIYNEEYTRKVAPFLDQEYFNGKVSKVVYNIFDEYFVKYNKLPTKEVISLELENLSSLNGDEYNDIKVLIESLNYEPTDLKWLMDKTEKFCQDRAIYNGIMTSVQILDGRDKKHDKGAIPKILSDALAVSFDTNIGHEFFKDAPSQWEYYSQHEERIAFDIDLLNKMTDGGLPKKTLNVILAGTNVGKSMVMCHMAAYNLLCGKNVVYITLEMSEHETRKRIDANVLGIDINELKNIERDDYLRQVEDLKKRMKIKTGTLIIKEYPTSQASANHFRGFLNDLKSKKNFSPDIGYLDYLNLCASARLKYNANVGSYTYVKLIAEEVRGLAMELDIPFMSASQFNRDGNDNSDPDMTNTAESFGLPMTADLIFALIIPDNLAKLNQAMVKKLKSRYCDVALYQRFCIGVDKAHMRLFNLEESAQVDLVDSPVSSAEKFDFGDFK